MPTEPDGSARKRLIQFARRFAASADRKDWRVQTAAVPVGVRLGYLEYALADLAQARARYVEAYERERAATDALEPGVVHAVTEDHERLMDETRETSFRLEYRIHTFFLFARILLDDIAALIDRAFGGSTVGGSHSRLAVKLQRLASDRELGEVPPDLLAAIEALSQTVKDFRDDYVAHLSRLRPNARPRAAVNPVTGETHLSIGWMYPKGTEPLGVLSADPPAVFRDMLKYLEIVLDFIEAHCPYPPPRR